MLGLIGAIWGIAGFLGLCLYAIFRLSPIVADSLQYELRWYHWLVMLGNMAMMAYYEGFKGFQRGYSPRVVARARHLISHPVLLHVALAPFFVMAYFYSSRRRIISAWVLTIAIVVLILLFTLLPKPWKGILDAGVVLGLSWGVVATVVIAIQTVIGTRTGDDPALPDRFSDHSPD